MGSRPSRIVVELRRFFNTCVRFPARKPTKPRPGTGASFDTGASFEVRAIGKVASPLTNLESAPRQPDEGAPEACLIFEPQMLEALHTLRPGDEVIGLTWLDRARPA